MVEVVLEDQGRGAGVDQAGIADAPAILFRDGGFGLVARECLVDEVHGQAEALPQLRDEGIDLLRLESGGAVHVEGIPHDEFVDPSLPDDLGEARPAAGIYRSGTAAPFPLR